MELQDWMRYILRALKNEDPHITWLFIPHKSYSYTVWVTEEGKDHGIQFVRGTKDHMEYIEAEKKVVEEIKIADRPAPKEMYS